MTGKAIEGGRVVDKEFFRFNIDSCKLSNGIVAHNLIKMAMAEIRKTSNINQLCPFPAGFYYINNFSPSTNQFLPYHLLGLTGKREYNILMKVKDPKLKALVNNFAMKVVAGTT